PAPPFSPRAFWRRLGPWLTAAGDADPPHVAAGKAGRGKAARTIGGKRGGASGAASRFHPTGRGGERSGLKRAFCSSLSELEDFAGAGCRFFPAAGVASSRLSIASTRPVGVSVW